MHTHSMDSLLTMAVDKLPWFRRNFYKLMLLNKTNRELALSNLTVKLHDDEEAQAMGFHTAMEGIASYSDPITFNPDNLAKILELILKYLPQILAIILPLFKVVGFIVFALSLSGTANAQCINGICQLPRKAVQAVLPQRQAAPMYASVSSVESFYVSIIVGFTDS